MAFKNSPRMQTVQCCGWFQSTESQLASKADMETKDGLQEEIPAEPEPPNPFSQLTDQELEEYKKEVERKELGLDGKSPVGRNSSGFFSIASRYKYVTQKQSKTKGSVFWQLLRW